MLAIFDWLISAPSGALAFITSVLAALVAVFVTALTQWILGRRARTDLLAKKLEELYLVLDENWTHHKLRNKFWRTLNALPPPNDPEASTDFSAVLEEGEALFSRREMYVGLYFPQMKPIHDTLSQKTAELTVLILRITDGERLDEARVLSKSTEFGTALGKMQRELIANRGSLINESWIARHHKREA